jgi:glyoxylase-like metal-dependent hydrolase (beta-lactamase superfamily II)
MRTWFSIGTVLILLFFSTLVSAQQGEISFKSTEVAAGLHMLEGDGGFAGGNMGLLVGEDGTILIDDSMPPFSDQLLSAVAGVTDDDVDFLINTHIHGDHIGNNELLGKLGATIVAHDNIRHRMVTDGVDSREGKIPAPKDALPVLTFSDAVTFHLNGHTAHVFHAAGAHTDGDAVIHFTDINVIHTGDVLFNGIFPYIDLDSGGSVDGFIHAQERILALANDDTRIIPGHGPLASKADLQVSIDMLRDSRERVAALVREGLSEDEIVAANPLASYHDDWNWGFITTERMTRTLVRGLALD